MSEKSNIVCIRNNSTLEESFKLPIEEILILDDENFFKAFEDAKKLVKKYIPNFDIKEYKIGGATNIRINKINYPFPILIRRNYDDDKKYDEFFPVISELENKAIVNYYLVQFKKFKSQ